MSGRDNQKFSSSAAHELHPPILDREHLSRYTMESEDLEREIIGLFLLQLPSIVGMLKGAADDAEWRLATHTLKGSALVLGAARIAEAAKELEAIPVASAEATKAVLIAVLDREIASFRQTADFLYR